MTSTSAGIQLMFASYLRIMAARMQCHTIKVAVENTICNCLHSIFFWFFDGLIDVDLSISRVIFHGHFLTCCLIITTGRGPGVGVDEV